MLLPYFYLLYLSPLDHNVILYIYKEDSKKHKNTTLTLLSFKARLCPAGTTIINNKLTYKSDRANPNKLTRFIIRV